MLVHEPADLVRGEESHPAQPITMQDVFEQGLERSPQPPPDRHTEALFPPPQDRVGYATGEGPFEQVLRGPPLDLQSGRHRAGELDEGMVQERSAGLEADGHRRSIHLHQGSSGEIELAVMVAEPIHWVCRPRSRHDVVDVVVGIELTARDLHRTREQASLLRASETAHQDLSLDVWRIAQAANEQLEKKVDASVLCGAGEPLDEPGYGIEQGARQTADPRRRWDGEEGRVPAPELVSTIASEGDRDRLPRVTSQDHGGEEGRIRQRLVEQPPEPGDFCARNLRREHDLLVVRPKSLRHRSRVWR